MTNGIVLMNNMVVNDPGFIVAPLAGLFGAVLNFIFEFVIQFFQTNTLGISIILLTLFTRVLMLPLAIKQQKSMVAMQALAPAINKIKKKYEGKKDQESRQRMNAEVQALYVENKVNPLGGCLPLLIQMPIFIGLNFIMQQAYRYVYQIGAVYRQLSTNILSLDDILGRERYIEITQSLFNPKIPQNITDLNSGVVEDIERIISRFSPDEWAQMLAHMPYEMHTTMQELLAQKDALEGFFGINLGLMSGFLFPGILIPILAVITTFLSSYLTTKLTSATTTDPNAKSMQRAMLFVMPIMMGFFTVNMAAGVGVYWITSSVLQVVQQITLNKFYIKRT